MSDHCSGNNGITQVEEKNPKSKYHCVFQEGLLSQAIVHEYTCAAQQTVKMALLVKPNPMLMFKKRVHSLEGGLDPSLLRWLPPVMLKRLPIKKNEKKQGLKCCLPF